ncbi:hypothetical protein [Foetidibacter luteolus]|uniref:hypothetical protein n=1 Tax=Foetidibacter luteolus TaxID=2608880 RepID=UPI00129AC651|nr:hypothetical protein [Foetidibacter luteolus]
MKLQKISHFFILLIVSSCQSQTGQYNLKYVVGEIDSLQSFSKLTSQEQKMDSLLQNSTWLNGAFRNNRSRIFMESFENGQLNTGGDSSLVTGLSAPCMCYTDKDTIYMKTWIGFFGSIGFGVKIFKDDFKSQFIIQIDEPDTYKVNLSDKDFTGQAIVNSKYQKLSFLTRPSFKIDEQLTGILEITTNDYYEKKHNGVDTLSVKGKIYFTCKTRQMTLRDQLMNQNYR